MIDWLPEIPTWIYAVLTGVILVLEAVAIFNRKSGDTISEWLRKILGKFPETQWGIFALGGFLVFLVWLGWHIAFQSVV